LCAPNQTRAGGASEACPLPQDGGQGGRRANVLWAPPLQDHTCVETIVHSRETPPAACVRSADDPSLKRRGPARRCAWGTAPFGGGELIWRFAGRRTGARPVSRGESGHPRKPRAPLPGVDAARQIIAGRSIPSSPAPAQRAVWRTDVRDGVGYIRGLRGARDRQSVQKYAHSTPPIGALQCMLGPTRRRKRPRRGARWWINHVWTGLGSASEGPWLGALLTRRDGPANALCLPAEEADHGGLTRGGGSTLPQRRMT
jgi:hypothetical protein